MPVMKELSKSLSTRPLKSLADLELKHGVVTQKGIFKADDIRKEVEAARKKGLIREDITTDEIRSLVADLKSEGKLIPADQPWRIDKDGIDATALGNIKSQWMNVTPAMAKRWLDNNFSNRKYDERTAEAYASDMVNDTWVPTHQGVAFNDKDEMIDGQHRLHAIIIANKTIRMMVTFGLPSKIEGKEMTTMDAVDRGRPRSVADQLTIQHGFKNGSIIAAVCASIGSLCFGKRTHKLSVGQTLDIFRAYEHGIHWVVLHRSKVHGLKAAGVLAAFAFALATEKGFADGHHLGPIASMLDRLLKGVDLKEGMPITHLRAFLVSDDAKLLNRGADRGVAELVLHAIVLEQKGKPVEALEMALGGVEYFRAKQPDRVKKVADLFQLPAPQKKE